MKLISVLSFYCLLHCSLLSAASIKVTAWNYYTQPPFITAENKGLIYDLVALINQYAQAQFELEVTNVPRARLNYYLNQKKQGVVLLVNQAWIKGPFVDSFLWTPPLLNDKNVLIFNRNKPVNFTHLASLAGLRFGIVRGRKHPYLSDMFKREQLIKVELNNETQILSMLKKQRIDVTILPYSVATQLISQLNYQQVLTYSDHDLFNFDRAILVTDQLITVHIRLNQIIEQLQQDKKWLAIVNQYQLKTVTNKLVTELPQR